MALKNLKVSAMKRNDFPIFPLICMLITLVVMAMLGIETYLRNE